MAVRRLGRVSVRELTERPGRSIRTLVGIALGVAVFLGVAVSNATVDRSLRTLFGEQAGTIDVVAQAAGAQAAAATTVGQPPLLPEGAAAAAARLPGVRSASPVLTATVFWPVTVNAGDPMARTLRSPSGGQVRFPTTIFDTVELTGADLARYPGDARLRAGRLPRDGEAGVAISPAVAAQINSTVGSTLDARVVPAAGAPSTLGPATTLHVTGVLADDGGYQGRALAPLDLVHSLRGKAGAASEIDLRLSKGVPVDSWIVQHRADLGPAVVLTDATVAAGASRHDARAQQDGFKSVAAIALFVGALLINLTLSMTVLERTRRYAVLRAVGAGRAQLAWLIVGESVALGVAGSILGVGVGVGFGEGLVRLSARLVDVPVAGMVVPVGAVVVAVGAGLAMTLAGSLVPAWRATRVPLTEALRGEVPHSERLPRTAIPGAVLFAGAAVAAPFAARAQTAGIAVLTVLLAGAVLCMPLVLAPVARTVGVATRRLSRQLGRVSVMHLVKERNRSAFTAGLILVVVAMALSISSGIGAVRQALDREVRARFRADMLLYDSRFTDHDLALFRSIHGVVVATPITRGAEAAYLTDDPSISTEVEVVDAATYFRESGFVWAQGSDARAEAALRAGGSVLLPYPTATAIGARVGGYVLLNTVTGPRRFTVAGRYIAVDRGPTIIAGAPDRTALLGPSASPSEVDIDLAPGVTPEAVLQDVSRARPFVPFSESGAAPRRRALQSVDRNALLYDAVLAVALLIGMLGLANTLAMSVAERRREIGMLRAIGTQHRTVRSLAVVEAATLTAAAYVLALPLGAIAGDVVIRMLGQAYGFRPTYLFPWTTVPALLIAAVVIVAVAAAWPAHQAATVDPVDALRFE